MRVKQQSGNVLILIIAILVAVLIVGILAWLFLANVIVGGQIYPKSAQYLNLREKELTLEEYDTLARKLPDSEIYWSIPFQGKTYPENTVVLNVTELSDEDLDAIGYFRYLEVVNAKDCRDYARLQALQDRYPDVTVAYAVYINDVPYELEAAQVTLTALTEQEIETLQYLPKLTSVDMGSCSDYTLLDKLMQTYPNLSITVKLGQDTYTSDTTELTVTGMTDAEAKSLAFFSGLTKLHLVDPVMDAQTLLGLQQTYPNAQITWEVDVLGVKLRSDATELDLMAAISEAGVKAYAYAATDIVTGNRDERVMIFAKRNSYPIEDLTDKTAELISQVESAMAYFPNVKKVNMCGAFLDNEAMAAFREAHREDYKVVWTVDCVTMAASTDTTYFMPYKYNVAYFFDEYTVNLRYCEEVVAVDLGHMSVHNADFVQYMPNLKYLILAHTQIADITPLQYCKSLLFLELDWSIVKDYTPLKGCTALEDLNLSKTYAPIDPILEMSWLKHLWITDRGAEVKAQLIDTFGAPWETEEERKSQTQIYLEGPSTVSGGWRELQNYYDMRDALNMRYMIG